MGSGRFRWSAAEQPRSSWSSAIFVRGRDTWFASVDRGESSTDTALAVTAHQLLMLFEESVESQNG